MPYSLNPTYRKFISEARDLERIIQSLSTQDKSIDRDTHIEGCFIRFVVAWEAFVEDYFLKCSCSANTRSGYLIRPMRIRHANTNEAFRYLNKHRRSRDKDFIDWLDIDSIKQKLVDNFRSNSRVSKLKDSPDKLYELKIIRNAIAHGSNSSITKFEQIVRDRYGYLRAQNPTMADLLIQRNRRDQKIMFKTLSEHYIEKVDLLTK